MKKRVLIVVTNHDRYTNGEPTGLWLGELIHFYDVFKEAGFALYLASPRGGEVPLDPRSLSLLFMDETTKRYHQDQDFMRRLEATPSLEAVDPQDYDAIYFTGGHGVMWDFPENERLQQIGRELYESGGIVSAVCHGSAGLLNIRLSDGSYLIEDKEVTGYSWLEEYLAMVAGRVPYNLEEQLKDRGADYSKGILPLRSHVVVDGRLVSGQNPSSSRATAQATLEAIHKYLS